MPRKLVIYAMICALIALFSMGQGCPIGPPTGGDTPPTDNTGDDTAGDDTAGDDGAGDNGTGDDGTTDDGTGDGSGDDDGASEIPGTINERHQVIFSVVIPEGMTDIGDCLACHAAEGRQIIATGHWKWQGTSSRIEGYETETHGKTDLINNFCIAVPSNEGRCTQCHIGVGWKDNTFNFNEIDNIDCLVCHDTSNTYKKGQTTAGAPADGTDLQQAAIRVGTPNRANCGSCHFYAGGGDNVKHGDLAASLVETTREYDVHMATDGGDFTCQKCHTVTDHKIAGMPLHSADEGAVACVDCHTGTIHSDPTITLHLAAVACQTCHIPAIARHTPTKVEWYWDEAGQNISPIPTDENGMALYDKKKGRFVWAKNVKPTLKWFNGKWNRMMLNTNDTYTTTPVVLAEPVGDISDLSAKIYPFKKMIGKQPADSVNQRLIVPHLFGKGPGPNPYWAAFDWSLALAEGAAYAGQPYSGEYAFVDTVMYLSVNHEIAPASAALGCTDCHDGGIDWTALGYGKDPWLTSDRD